MESGFCLSNQVQKKNQTNIKILIILVFLLALGVRLYRINTHPLVFQPIKQYHSALIARAVYCESEKNIGNWKKNPSIIYRKNIGTREPQIIEHLSATGYKLAKGEHIWIPRLLSVLFWIFGGLFVYVLVNNLFNSLGALFSLLFYLFLPSGINISQSIMPESLMITLYIISILMIVRYYGSPTIGKLILAAVFSGIAILIKFVVVFPLFGAFVFLGIRKLGIKKFFLNIRTVEFFLITCFIGIMYYLYQVLFPSPLHRVMTAVIIPELLFNPFFWKGWLQQIGKVTGLIPFFLSVFCLFTVKDRTTRALFLGLVSGYFFYGIIFSYNTFTHDYHQMALFPIVIIMLGQIGKLVEERPKIKLFQKKVGLFPIMVSFTLLVVLFSLIYNIHFLNNSNKNTVRWPSFLLCGNQFAYFSNNRIDPKIIKNGREIGEAVSHSTRTVILSGAYGIPLMYYGHFYGKSWPTEDDFWYKRLRGIPVPGADERLNGYFREYNPEYFIIHDKHLLKDQPDLAECLKKRFVIIKETQHYVIYKVTN